MNHIIMFIKLFILFILFNVYYVPLNNENIFLRHVLSLFIVMHLIEIVYYSGYLFNNRYSYWIITFPLTIYAIIAYLSPHISFDLHMEVIFYQYVILFMGLLSDSSIISSYIGTFIAIMAVIYVFNMLFVLFNSYIVLYFFILWILHTLLLVVEDNPIKNTIYDILDLCITSAPALALSYIIYNKHYLLYQRHYTI